MAMTMKKIMILAEDPATKRLLSKIVEKSNYKPMATSYEESFAQVNECQMCIVDLELENGHDGAEWSREAKRRNPKLIIILLAASWQPELADHRADRLMCKPVSFPDLKESITILLPSC